MARMGIESTFVSPDATEEEFRPECSVFPEVLKTRKT